MGAISSLLGKAAGYTLRESYYPVFEMGDGTAVYMSENLSDSDDFPEYDILIEQPHNGGFRSIVISSPYVEVKSNSGFDGNDLDKAKRVVGLNTLLFMDTDSERRSKNA